MEAQVEVEKFAEKLARIGREAVAWERRKLQWILEERARSEMPKATDSDQGNAG